MPTHMMNQPEMTGRVDRNHDIRLLLNAAAQVGFAPDSVNPTDQPESQTMVDRADPIRSLTNLPSPQSINFISIEDPDSRFRISYSDEGDATNPFSFDAASPGFYADPLVDEGDVNEMLGDVQNKLVQTYQNTSDDPEFDESDESDMAFKATDAFKSDSQTRQNEASTMNKIEARDAIDMLCDEANKAGFNLVAVSNESDQSNTTQTWNANTSTEAAALADGFNKPTLQFESRDGASHLNVDLDYSGKPTECLTNYWFTKGEENAVNQIMANVAYRFRLMADNGRSLNILCDQAALYGYAPKIVKPSSVSEDKAAKHVDRDSLSYYVHEQRDSIITFTSTDNSESHLFVGYSARPDQKDPITFYGGSPGSDETIDELMSQVLNKIQEAPDNQPETAEEESGLGQ